MSLESRLSALVLAIAIDIKALTSGKVSVVTGKGLSTNDYTTAEKTKLAGIATGATANSTDAVLLARANHTGTQAISTVSGLQAALDAAEPGIAAGTTAQFWRGDKSWQALNKAAVGLGNVDNTTDAAKPVSTAQQTALNLKANLASPTFTGTPAAPTAAAGTNTTQIASTAFVRSEVSAAIASLVATAPTTLDTLNEIAAALGDDPNFAATMTAALGEKAPINNPTFTGTVGGITKAMVGLGNVDNTADSAKPVSTAQQAALNLKANLASPTFTGIPAVPTASDGTSTTQAASTAFVQNAVGGALSKTTTGGALVLTAAEASNPVIIISGALTSNAILEIPVASRRIYSVQNGTTGAFTLTVKHVGLTPSVLVAQNKRNLIFTNGSGAYDAINDFDSVALTGVPTAPTAALGTNTTQIATMAAVQAANLSDTGGAATALTLKTARTIAISGAATGSATAFNGGSNIIIPMTALDASSLSSGTVPNARMSGLYDGITLKVNGTNTVFSDSMGNALGRTVYGLAAYRSSAGAQVGAIVFTAPDNSSAIMHQLEISLMLYSPARAGKVLTNCYRSSATAINQAATTQLGSIDVPVRWAIDPTGKTCVILGTETSSWSYPHAAITEALFSHVGVTDAYCTGWTASVVTSLTGYTAITTATDLPSVVDVAGNAATATKLATARNLGMTGDGTWSVSFDGAGNATAAMTLANVATAGTYRSVTVNSKGLVTSGTTVVIGLATSTSAAGTTNLATGNTNTYLNVVENVGGAVGSAGSSTQITGAGTVTVASDTAGKLTITGAQTITGNAGTATALQTGRTINNTSFNGTGNITTAIWGTTRNFTLGATTKGVNGSANMTWTLAEMGAVDKTGDVMTGDLTVPSLNGGPLAGLRNFIINGAGRVCQRNDVRPFAALQASEMAADRWRYGGSNNAAGTISQVADAPSGSGVLRSMRVTITTADTSIAAGQYGFLQQLIEGINVMPLVGSTFTLSFLVRSPKVGWHCVSFRNAGADRSYIAEYYVNAANTWEEKSITVTGGLPTDGTWNYTNGTGLDVSWCLASGTTFHGAANTWLSANDLATSRQVNCLDAAGNIFGLTRVQLELGSYKTPYEQLPYPLELALCQRYFETSRVNILSGTHVAGAYMGARIQYKATKRSGATIALYSVVYSSNVTNVYAVNSTLDGCGIYCQGVNASTAAEYVADYWIDAELG